MPCPRAVECQGPPCGSSRDPCCQPAPPIILSSVPPLPQHTKWHPWQVPPSSTSVPPQAVPLISDPNLGSPLRACLLSRPPPGIIPRDFAPSPAGGQAVTQSPGLAQISTSQSRFCPLMISISSAELPGTKAALATGQFIKSRHPQGLVTSTRGSGGPGQADRAADTGGLGSTWTGEAGTGAPDRPAGPLSHQIHSTRLPPSLPAIFLPTHPPPSARPCAGTRLEIPNTKPASGSTPSCRNADPRTGWLG